MELLRSVKEGTCRFGADLSHGPAMVTTLGTFHLHRQAGGEGGQEEHTLSPFEKNLARCKAT